MRMVKRALPILLIMALAASGCGKSKSPVVMKVGDISVTQSEFEEAYSRSQAATRPTPEARKEFLDSYINGLLVLREAERVGLDKNPEFLKDVQVFWRQSLIKRMLMRKAREIETTTRVTDSEIRDYYEKNREMFKDKTLDMIYGRIRWMLMSMKHRQAVAAWVKYLRDSNKVDVNYNMLKIRK